MNVGAEIQFAGKDAMAAAMPRQKRDFTSFQRAAHIGVGRRAERRLQPRFLYLAQPRHRVEPAAADNPDFRLCQSSSGTLPRAQVKIVIIQDGNQSPGSGARPLKLPRVNNREGSGATIRNMRFSSAACALLLMCGFSDGQDKPALAVRRRTSVTVPAAIDHNRVVIDADLPLPNGSTERVHAWVDNGNPDLYLSRRWLRCWGSRFPAMTVNARLRRRRRSSWTV